LIQIEFDTESNQMAFVSGESTITTVHAVLPSLPQTLEKNFYCYRIWQM